MVISNTCIPLLLAINKICSIYGRTGCLFHLSVDTEDIALFYFFYELHNDLLLVPKKNQNKKNKFLVSEQGHGVEEMAKMEEQRTRKSKNGVTSRHYSSIHLSISASLVYLFIYFPCVLSLIHRSLCKFSHSCQAEFPSPAIIMLQDGMHKDGGGRRAAYKYFHIVGIVKD